MEEVTTNVAKKSHKGLIVGIVVVLALVLLGVLGYFYFHKNKPEDVFSSLVKSFDKQVNNTTTGYKQLKTNFELSLNVDAGEEYKSITDIVNNVLLKISVNSDLNTKELLANVKAEYKNKNVIDVDAFYTDSKLYVDLKDLFDKTLYTDVEVDDEEVNVTVDDVQVLYTEVSAAVKKALKEGLYTQESTELNGSKVTKNVLTINNDNREAIVKAAVDYLKSSDKFLETVAKISKETKEEVKADLEEDLEFDKLENDIKVAVYTKGLTNRVVKFAVETDKEIISVTEVKKNNYDFVIKDDDSEAKCSIVSESETKANGTCNMEVEGIKISYTVKVETERNVKLEKPDTSKAVKFEDLSDEETYKILENAMKKDGLNDLLSPFLFN